jgi:hypothetical protein
MAHKTQAAFVRSVSRLPEASFDKTVSFECFELNPYWREPLAHMFRLTRPSGLILLTHTTTGQLEHSTTSSSTDLRLTPLNALKV